MAIYREKEIICPKCNTIYDAKYPTFISVPGDDELKADLVSADIHYHECPNCGHNEFSPSPSLYVDDEKQVVVINDNYEDAIFDRKELKEEFPNYKFYISEATYTTSDIINAIDNGVDPFVLEFIKYDGRRYFERNHKHCQAYNSYIEYSDDGYEMKLVVLYYDIKNHRKETSLTITSSLYNDYVNKLEELRKEADDSVISPIYVKKFYYLDKNSKIDEARGITYEFLQCRDEYDATTLAFVQSFNNGKFKEGEKVALVDYNGKNTAKIKICYVNKIIHMTDYEFYSEINDLPVATYKPTDMELESELDSETELHNELLKNELIAGFESKNYNALFNANVIVPMKFSLYEEDFFENQPDSLKEVNMEYNEEDKTYYSLYLEQEDIKNEELSSKIVVSFKSVLRKFFNIANEYDGIIINPDTDKFKISVYELFNLIANRIMTNHDLMKDFINNASNEEIAFIGEENYNLIKVVYSTNIGLPAIREKLNLTEDQAGYMLGDGYARIKRIIKSHELM